MKQSNFERFNLKPFIIESIMEQGFKLPTEIQERLIPSIMNGTDAIGKSQTGTGKTLAYLLPIVNNIDPTIAEVQAVITAPTRELAKQIYAEILKLTAHAPEGEKIEARCIVGGTDRSRTIGKLAVPPHIVVATPGRLMDIVVKEQALSIFKASTLVVDEADVMLDMGFINEVDQLASRMKEDVQMLVFSATIPEKLQPFLKKYMQNPKFIEAKGEQATKPKIEHVIIPVRHREKIDLLERVTKSINPYFAIVFTNTKKQADEVANALQERGINVGRLHGSLTPRQRNKVMKDVLDVKMQYLVATDIAARGIDIKGVSHIINYELPEDLDFYIHRSGRTGRAGAEGIAITLYEISDEDALARLTSKGINFAHKDIKNNEFIELAPLRRKRVKKADENQKTFSKLKSQHKVKPGYKKKLKKQAEQMGRRNKQR
ncbi:DEAD/DEAH box helicase [Lottiidibacillus patelloidae]|uniref:DEAD/DEAH box helicase n=1 Tax=Lottiidibacillus patelloidae TaxID=2670334 RepID=A0A263BVY8_9BACI|nr:DEAD/DEAH box helicase [Lottiidibacillus patelloidae]OZM57712.1 DEAD/DEAH box helicase [Lottiidibacillus patelloidae]